MQFGNSLKAILPLKPMWRRRESWVREVCFLGLNNSLTTGCDSSHCDPGLKTVPRDVAMLGHTRQGPSPVQHGAWKHGTQSGKDIKMFRTLYRRKNQHLKQAFVTQPAANVNFQSRKDATFSVPSLRITLAAIITMLWCLPSPRHLL